MVEGFSPDTVAGPSSKISVHSVIRYGIQVITQIGGTAVAKPAISRQKIAVEEGRRFLCFDLANNGERWLQPQMEVRLFDHEGRALAVLPSPKSRIYPGTTAQQRFDLSRFSRGDYLFTPYADTGGGRLPSDVGQIATALWLPYWFWGALCAVASLWVLGWGVQRYWR